MGIFQRVCSVCANREIRERVDAMLESGEHTQLQIASMVGVSDSSISRHKLKCFREPDDYNRYFDGNRDAFSIVWPGQPDPPEPKLKHGGLHWIFRVRYEDAPTVETAGNPYACMNDAERQAYVAAQAAEKENAAKIAAVPTEENPAT